MSKVCQSKKSALFLSGDLNPIEEKNFIEHLSECTQCQGQLQTLAGDATTWEMAHSMLEFEPASEAFERTQALVHDAPNRGELAAVLGLLHPSDDPRMIGRIGNYEVIGLIGRGGMGVVFKAFDRSLNRNVAVKVLEPSLAHIGAARQRFAREAQTMASISHENVIPIFAVAEHAGLPYFVMEYADGGTLEQRLAEEGAFPAIDVMQIGLQIAKALEAAHRQGLVHRDIKPGNVLMYRGTSRVRVADFGLVQVASEASFTRSGMLAGTPAFMSPEQIRGEVCDHRSDLFSLGTLLYTLSVGHAPFRAETVYGVMQRIVHDTPRRIIQQNGAIPVWLENLIRQLMHKSREARLHDAATVAGILEREIAHHQNPASIREPERNWIVDVDASSSKKRIWMWPAVSALLLTIVISIPLAIRQIQSSKIDSVSKVRQKQETQQQPVPNLQSEIPGWNDAEIRSVKARADSLWNEMHRSQAISQEDELGQQLESARTRIEELMRDFEGN